MFRGTTVLVTGVGAIIGYGIIKSIRERGDNIRIIGMDIYSDAVGRYWCDEFIQAKYAADEDYISFLKDAIDSNNINLVFFGTEQEIYKVDCSRNELQGYIDKMVVNSHLLLELSKDKWLTYQFLCENGLEKYAIPSVITGDYCEISRKFGREFLLKPRASYASKGLVKISTEEEFAYYKNRMGDNFMAQPVIGDNEHEFTVAVFGLGNGIIHASIALRRKLSQEGATAKAWTFSDDRLSIIVNQLVEIFKPVGPMNLQFRYEDGNYYLLEINPRISSSTSIRCAFGYNEAGLCLDYFLDNKLETMKLNEGCAIRFIDEVVIYS